MSSAGTVTLHDVGAVWDTRRVMHAWKMCDATSGPLRRCAGDEVSDERRSSLKTVVGSWTGKWWGVWRFRPSLGQCRAMLWDKTKTVDDALVCGHGSHRQRRSRQEYLDAIASTRTLLTCGRAAAENWVGVVYCVTRFYRLKTTAIHVYLSIRRGTGWKECQKSTQTMTTIGEAKGQWFLLMK